MLYKILLPAEILEVIFSKVSIKELCILNTVYKNFNKIINNDDFLKIILEQKEYCSIINNYKKTYKIFHSFIQFIILFFFKQICVPFSLVWRVF